MNSREGATVSAPAGVRSVRVARIGTLIERGLLCVGIALFVYLLVRLGAATVWRHLRGIGWGFVPIIGQEILAVAANTLGWRAAFPPNSGSISFSRLLAARIVGDGINCVTPTATIGGEFVRGRMIEGEASPTAVWASVAVAKISQTVAQLTFIVGGLLFVLTRTPLPAAVHRGLLIGVPVFSFAVFLTVVLQRHGLFTVALRLLSRVHVPVPVAVQDLLHRLDAEIRRVYAAPGPFLRSTGWFLVGWCVGVLEIYLLLHFLHVGASWSRALTIETLSVTIDALLFFVPAKAGTQEGGKVLIFTLLGLDPTRGLSLGIVRRIRELSWAAFGLFLLARDRSRRGV